MKQIKKKLISLTLSAALVASSAFEVGAVSAFADDSSEESAVMTDVSVEEAKVYDGNFHGLSEEQIQQRQLADQSRREYYEALERERQEQSEPQKEEVSEPLGYYDTIYSQETTADLPAPTGFKQYGDCLAFDPIKGADKYLLRRRAKGSDDEFSIDDYNSRSWTYFDWINADYEYSIAGYSDEDGTGNWSEVITVEDTSPKEWNGNLQYNADTGMLTYDNSYDFEKFSDMPENYDIGYYSLNFSETNYYCTSYINGVNHVECKNQQADHPTEFNVAANIAADQFNYCSDHTYTFSISVEQYVPYKYYTSDGTLRSGNTFGYTAAQSEEITVDYVAATGTTAAPTGVSASGSLYPTVTWGKVDGAVGYIVKFSGYHNRAYAVDGSSTRLSISERFSEGDYDVCVYSIDKTGNISATAGETVFTALDPLKNRWDAGIGYNELTGTIAFNGNKDYNNDYYLYYRTMDSSADSEYSYDSLCHVGNTHDGRYYSDVFMLQLASESLRNSDRDLSDIAICAVAKDSSWNNAAYSEDFAFSYDGCDEVSTIAAPTNLRVAGKNLVFDGSYGAVGYVYSTDDSTWYNYSDSCDVYIGEGAHTVKIAAIDANGDRSKFVTVTRTFGFDSWVSGINLTNGVLSVKNNYDANGLFDNVIDRIRVGNYYTLNNCPKDRATLFLTAYKIQSEKNNNTFDYDGKIYALAEARIQNDFYNYTSPTIAESSDYVEFPYNGGKTVTTIAAPKNITCAKDEYNNYDLNWDAVSGAIGYIVVGKYNKGESWTYVNCTETTSTDIWYYCDLMVAAVDVNGNISEFASFGDVDREISSDLETWKSNISYNKSTDTISWTHYPVTGLSGSGTWGDYLLNSNISKYIAYSDDLKYENGKLTNNAPSFSNVLSILGTEYYAGYAVPCGDMDFYLNARQRVPYGNNSYTYKTIAESSDSVNIHFDRPQVVSTISAPTGFKDDGTYLTYTSPAGAKNVIAVIYSKYGIRICDTGTYGFHYPSFLNNTIGTYKIALASIDKDGNRSELSDFVTVEISPSKVPTISSAKSTTGGVTLTWNSVSGATNYRVYRADSVSGTKTLLTTTASTSYTDKTAAVGKTYYYFVTSYTSEGWSDYSAARSVTVENPKPAAPVIASATTTASSVTLTWNAVDKATSYRIYRASSATGTKTQLKAVTTTSYTDTTVTAGNTYYYFVAAFNSNASSLSDYSAAKSVTVYAVAAPTITSLTSGANCANLKWSAVSGATSYRIYRRNPNSTGTGTLIKTVTGTSYTDPNLTAGKVYTYFIRAYNGKTSQISGFSSGRAICICSVAAPSNITIKSGSSKVMLSWDKVDGATSYRVYRAESQTGTKVEIKKLTGTSFTDTNVKAGKTYFYYLRAFNGTTSKISGYSSGKAICVSSVDIPKMTSVTASGKKVTIKWGAVDGATSYRVYRSTTPNSGISLVKAVNSTTFTLTDTVSANGTYYYYVKAYNGTTGSLSSYSDYLTVKIG